MKCSRGETPVNYQQLPWVVRVPAVAVVGGCTVDCFVNLLALFLFFSQYGNFSAKGFTILAFPCNQFMNQEPDSNAVIKQFAQSKGCSFPFFAKSNVNPPPCSGDVSQCLPSSSLCCPNNNPVYQFLQSVIPGAVDWNFHKYLVGRDGVPVQSYAVDVDPLSIVPDIVKLL